MLKKNKHWLLKNSKDTYIIQAKINGFKSRSAFKLIEIQKKFMIFNYGMNILELGAYPGGWTQIIKKNIGEEGKIFAVDLKSLSKNKEIFSFIAGDITCNNIKNIIIDITKNYNIKWIISDISPNISGNKILDQNRFENIIDSIIELSDKLKTNCNILFKIFQGHAFNKIFKKINCKFKNNKIFKPNSSRCRSKEIYCICKN